MRILRSLLILTVFVPKLLSTEFANENCKTLTEYLLTVFVPKLLSTEFANENF